ncbi:hypothetical protein G5C60_08180 [Streptomyces sp. HC44]|uniref:Uncharacterized protein n=1 Tax=Streptomyces scabichelini TaxID=2711217 RepID=A0A6G4V157_9ACTN|nr:hypothetical protein [Streptomyces scabichelini]NGO07630.1 hypothetical protein [Streptomyces scabichelini]
MWTERTATPGRATSIAGSGNPRAEYGSAYRRATVFWVFPGSPDGLDTSASQHITEGDLDLE